jgi:hypothetical protein
MNADKFPLKFSIFRAYLTSVQGSTPAVAGSITSIRWDMGPQNYAEI